MKTNKKIQENISASIQSPLKYVAFIDVGSYITRGSGLLSTILKDMGSAKISRLFRPIASSDDFKSKTDAFKAVSARFASNPSLKTLYIAVNKLKSSASGKEDTTEIQKDMQLLVNKIGKMISSKMSEEDKELFNLVSPKLDSIAGVIANSIDSSLEPTPAAEKPEETPEEKPEETPAETPAEEKPEETPEETSDEKPEESDEESSTKKEQLERRVKNIVREILRKSVTKK